MDDLITAISGNMHVSQDGYDIKALQEYLAATISLPHLQVSPANAFRQLPTSRSASSTRKHLAHSYLPESSIASSSTSSHVALPSPSVPTAPHGGYWGSAEDISMSTPAQRPGALRRTSSYGFGGTKEFVAQQQDTYAAFQEDAFAPLYQGSTPHSAPNTFVEKQNPWAGFNGASSAFGYRQPGQQGLENAQERGRQVYQPEEMEQRAGRMEEEVMDEEWADQCMDEMDDEDSVEDAMGLDEQRTDRYQYQTGFSGQSGFVGWDGMGRHHG